MLLNPVSTKTGEDHRLIRLRLPNQYFLLTSALGGVTLSARELPIEP